MAPPNLLGPIHPPCLYRWVERSQKLTVVNAGLVSLVDGSQGVQVSTHATSQVVIRRWDSVALVNWATKRYHPSVSLTARGIRVWREAKAGEKTPNL